MQINMKAVKGLFRVPPPLGITFLRSKFLYQKLHSKVYLSLILASLLLFSFSVPAEFCRAISSPTFWTSRYFMTGLVDEGSPDAGVKGYANEYGYFPTSRWTQMMVDLKLGSFICSANLIQIPGTMIPMTFSLTYSSLNASLDIGMGKGWTSNLHTCVSEDSSTHDLTYVTPSGAHLVFEWDSTNEVYINPLSFTGMAVKNQDDTYTIQNLSGQISTFNSSGKLTTLSSLTGGTLTVGYDGSGRPVTVTDSKSSRAITLTWSTGGKVSSVDDAMGNTWSFTYSESGNDLLEIQQPSNESPNPDIHTTFEYDGNHKIVSQTDFLGFEYTITYHTSGYQTGKVSTLVEPTEDSATTSFAYVEDSGGFDKKTTVTDGEDRDTDYYFDDTSTHLEKISAIVGAVERKTELDYNGLGLVSVSRDSGSNATTYTYDTVGHVTAVTYPETTAGIYIQQYTYSPANDVEGKLVEAEEKVTSSVWATTTFDYTDQDAPFSPSSIINPLDEETEIAYNSDKQPTSIITPAGTTTLTYNANTGNLSSVTDPEGNQTSFSAYNANGFVTEKLDMEGSSVLLNHWDYTINEVNITTEAENTETEQIEGITADGNGSSVGTASLTGCETSLSYTETVASVAYLVAQGLMIAPPTSGASGGAKSVFIGGDLFYPEPKLPFDPNPITTTNAMEHTTTHDYDNSGSLSSTTNYLSQTSTITRDGFGSVDTVTNPFGRLTEYTLNTNGWTTAVEIEGVGTYSYTRDVRGQVTTASDPIQGTLSYTYNIRGDTTSDPKGTYSMDILGRKTNISYTGGGSDTVSYDAMGLVTSLNDYDFTYDDVGNLATWSDGSNTATYSYVGYSRLGLPVSVTGTGDLSSYSFSYNAKHWLSTMTDTGKSDMYTYAWNEDSTLASLIYPNDIELSQTWSNKKLATVTVENGEDTFLSTSSTFNGDDQKTAYESTVYAGENTTFSEDYEMTYDSLKRISTLTDNSDSKVLTYSYDTTKGNLTSILDSLLEDSYDIGYDSKDRIGSIVYPGIQGSSSFTYNDTTGKGRLEEISYPGNRAMTLTWDGRDRITNITFDDNGTETSYALTYNDQSQVKRIAKSVDSQAINSWNFSYGPHGLEKGVVKSASNQVLLTQDYTTDPSGTILSMSYTPTENFGGTYTGELFVSYDPCGNLSLLTNATGSPALSASYNSATGIINNIWNPDEIELPIFIGAKGGNLSIKDPWDGWAEIPEHPIPGSGITVTDGISVTVTPNGTGVTSSSPCDDDETGTCGLGTPEEQFDACMTDCYDNKTGREDWEGDAEKYAKWQGLMNIIDNGLTKIFLKDIPNFVKTVLKMSFTTLLNSVTAIIDITKSLTTYFEDIKTVEDARKAQTKLEKDDPWLNNCADRKIARDALNSCADSCHYLLGDGNY